MRAIGKISTASLSNKIFEKGQPEEEDNDKKDMEILEVPVADEADKMYVENGTAVSIPFFNVIGSHQGFFVRMKHIEDLYAPLREVIISHQTSKHASLHFYGSGYFGCILSVPFRPVPITKDMLTIVTSGMTVRPRVLSSGAKFLLLDRPHHLEVMRQFDEKGEP